MAKDQTITHVISVDPSVLALLKNLALLPDIQTLGAKMADDVNGLLAEVAQLKQVAADALARIQAHEDAEAAADAAKQAQIDSLNATIAQLEANVGDPAAVAQAIADLKALEAQISGVDQPPTP